MPLQHLAHAAQFLAPLVALRGGRALLFGQRFAEIGGPLPRGFELTLKLLAFGLDGAELLLQVGFLGRIGDLLAQAGDFDLRGGQLASQAGCLGGVFRKRPELAP